MTAALALAPLDRINALRERARFFAARRRSDGELYTLLGACLAVCEDVQREGRTSEVADAVRAKPARGRSRVYVERGSDVFHLVGRLVFEDDERRSANAHRYGATLREAAKQGIGGADLAGWLAENGGINALFRRRPVDARTLSTRTLHLNAPVTVPRDGTPFTVTLRHDGAGFFDVVEAP